jgi:hypothetical protein
VNVREIGPTGGSMSGCTDATLVLPAGSLDGMATISMGDDDSVYRLLPETPLRRPCHVEIAGAHLVNPATLSFRPLDMSVDRPEILQWDASRWTDVEGLAPDVISVHVVTEATYVVIDASQCPALGGCTCSDPGFETSGSTCICSGQGESLWGGRCGCYQNGFTDGSTGCVCASGFELAGGTCSCDVTVTDPLGSCACPDPDFAPAGLATPIPMNLAPIAGVAGHFDGDKNLDVAVLGDVSSNAVLGNYTADAGGYLVVLHGNGHGGFSSMPADSYPVGSAPVLMESGDFNADGFADIATVDAQKGLQIFEGSANGGFTIGQNVQLPDGARGLVAGDFNGDGRTDLAIRFVYEWNQHDFVEVAISSQDGLSLDESHPLEIWPESPNGDNHAVARPLSTFSLWSDGFSDLAAADPQTKRVAFFRNLRASQSPDAGYLASAQFMPDDLGFVPTALVSGLADDSGDRYLSVGGDSQEVLFLSLRTSGDAVLFRISAGSMPWVVAPQAPPPSDSLPTRLVSGRFHHRDSGGALDDIIGVRLALSVFANLASANASGSQMVVAARSDNPAVEFSDPAPGPGLGCSPVGLLAGRFTAQDVDDVVLLCDLFGPSSAPAQGAIVVMQRQCGR